MTADDTHASIAIAGHPLNETVDFFTTELGFRLDRIGPADNPTRATVAGHGITLELDSSVTDTPPVLRIESGQAARRIAPNGMEIQFVDRAASSLAIPELEPELVISTAADESAWVVGRAGMRYRDLIPSRLGGRYIASHIEVCDGGPVPDLVHHHAIRFQMIFCHRGWVDVVYEDQGEPFRLEAGDAVLQPPHIRHRVLASSAGAQVVEIGCPADHDTFFDHELQLPTSTMAPERDFGGQRFLRHRGDLAPWGPSVHPGFDVQETGIEAATDGLARVQILRASSRRSTAPTRHLDDLWFLFVLHGSTEFSVDGSTVAAPLLAGDSVTVPAGVTWCLRNASPDVRLLQVVVT